MTDRRRMILPLITLLAGLLGTAIASMQTYRVEAARNEARFVGLAAGAVADIESRMLAQLTLLRGTAGFFNASAEVTREDFRIFVHRLRLERNYPGVLGIGFAAYARDREGLTEIVEQARRNRAPNFRPWPGSSRTEGLSAILYLEPLDRRNQAALGYDMLSEATRRAAMEQAAEQRRAITSGKVTLVQEIEAVKQPGFLIYLPLYSQPGTAIPPDGEDRLRGWIYSPLRAYDLFSAIFAQSDLAHMTVEIYDEAVAPERLLFRSAAPAPDPGHVALRSVSVAGRDWVIRISSTPEFDAQSLLGAGGIMAVAGLMISLLVATLMFQQARAARETERQVERRTAELRAANERIGAEAMAREEAEAQLRQVQKMEAIGQLTGGIAHDFNNMLAIIIGNLDMAERRMDQPEKLRRAIGNAMTGARKAAELTQRLLAFGRRQALAPRPLDLNSLIADMSDILTRTLGATVRLETQFAERLWLVRADPVQLENAILNLALNARDAMPEGGTLTVATRNLTVEDGDTAAAAGIRTGDHVLMSISDTGHGMSEEVAAKSMEPFFTTKSLGRGTGLGLSQVYGFVKQSGGHFRIQSELGRGTRVAVYLPRHGGDEPVVERVPEEEDAVPKGRPEEIILVAEDETQVRAVAAEALRELGYSVVEAEGSLEVLRLLDEIPGIQLLFTDVIMPEMTGPRLAAEALQRNPDLKIVFTTGYAPEEMMEDAGLAEGAMLLRKPFSRSELASRIREALDDATL